MDKAIVFNIMHYAVHDGPGIRTTVFFKGCPLSCKWCHNPESMDPQPYTVFNKKKCIQCGQCVIGDDGAIRNGGAIKNSGVSGVSSNNCPTGARETIGYEISVSELMGEIRKDMLFYEQSGGGVTFSGGEPLYQADFLLQVLAQCREDCINTAIDTSGYGDTGILLKAAEITNYFLYDIKLMSSNKHEQYCGLPNDLVLYNLRQLANHANARMKLLIRIPVIPSVNDDISEMNEIFEFIKDFSNIAAVHLLPYHNIQADKYNRMGKQYELAGISGDESPNMGAIHRLFSSKFTTKIGG